MKTMVDRIAEAIYPRPLCDMTAMERELYQHYAKCALEAVREPTDGMIDAAYTGYDSVGCGIGRRDALEVWQAMIDAALNAPQT